MYAVKRSGDGEPALFTISRRVIGEFSMRIVDHPDYNTLATHTIVSHLRQRTRNSFSKIMKELYNNSYIADDVYKVIRKNAARLDKEIVHKRDLNFDYYGLKILENCIFNIERPQHMLMRVAIGIHKDDIDSAVETYHMMSQHWFIHAFPTLFNSGRPSSLLSSCFQVTCLKEDSIERILDNSNEHKSVDDNIRSIVMKRTTKVIAPMLRVLNDTSHDIDREGLKRKDAFAVYMEPWHVDIFKLLTKEMKEHCARDIYCGLWVPDLFMQRAQSDGKWSLFCPNEAPGLVDCWGEEFEKLYLRYEQEGKARKVVQARDLWSSILKSQVENKIPYVFFKDTCMRKSNMQNLGTTKLLYAKDAGLTEAVVCNLASIVLPKFAREKGIPYQSHPSKLIGSRGSKNRFFDFDKLAKVTSFVTSNLNKIIDVNDYPNENARKSTLQHRPISISVQGLADTFILLGMAYDSPEARQLNKDIFETIYYHALLASSKLAAVEGVYETYNGCPISKGILQPDMWGITPSNRWDWSALRKMISKNGVRNSLLIAPRPNASICRILGNNKCYEPYRSNICLHRFSRHGFHDVNKHLQYDLTKMDLWNHRLHFDITDAHGSVQNISNIPDELKNIYKTSWEINQQTLIDMAIDRGCYIDQSQSLNITMEQANFEKLSSLYFYAWSKGLKAGMFYVPSYRANDDFTDFLKENGW